MDKTREVYKDISTMETIPKLNPFVELPRMRVNAINRLNELIERDTPKPLVADGYDIFDETERKYACPTCGGRVHDDEMFCKHCGQRLDLCNVAL